MRGVVGIVGVGVKQLDAQIERQGSIRGQAKGKGEGKGEKIVLDRKSNTEM